MHVSQGTMWICNPSVSRRMKTAEMEANKGKKDNNLCPYFTDKDLVENRKPSRVRKWIAVLYLKWWISNDYSASGVNVSNAIKPRPVCTLEIMLLSHCKECGSTETKF